MTLRAAVVGVGAMGRHHARVYHEMDDVELVGVADPDPASTEFIARRYGAPTFADYRALLGQARPDLVSIVVPTKMHLMVASDVMDAGAGVMIEKPLAATVQEGRALCAKAAERGVVLTVGHIERFNPAIRALKERLDANQLGRIFSLRAQRTGPFPARVRDVGVVIDLATHDIDIMRWLVGTPVTRIQAELAQRIHTAHEDLLAGLLRFESGEIGLLDINWLTPTKVRQLSVTGERGMFVANYLSQELTFYENLDADRHWERYGELQGVGEGNIVRLAISRMEPLAAELGAFVTAVRDKSEPLVSGADGLRALALAHAVVRAGRGNVVERPEENLMGDDEVVGADGAVGENEVVGEDRSMGDDRPMGADRPVDEDGPADDGERAETAVGDEAASSRATGSTS